MAKKKKPLPPSALKRRQEEKAQIRTWRDYLTFAIYIVLALALVVPLVAYVFVQ